MDTFQALLEPRRRRIVEILSKKGELPASQIYKEFKISNSAISQHLKALEKTQIVIIERKAQQRLYKLNPKKMLEMENWIKNILHSWEKRFNRIDQLLKKEFGGKNNE